MIALMLAVASASATFGFLVSYAWTGRLHRRARERATQEIAARVHDVRQPIQAIELYASAISRRIETEDAREIVARLHLAVADLHARLSDLAQGVSTPPAREGGRAVKAST
ncbi:MAG: hypothetical protein FD124_166 [Alphaproteobacteria bacterium]|nr:MAG: hypothetical protein FD160_1194 [Caulobacteraceae bacterium]TPW08780.1 MAG: hypothetical protein FD124_166 [Alphaproteobacteria bacterium]